MARLKTRKPLQVFCVVYIKGMKGRQSGWLSIQTSGKSTNCKKDGLDNRFVASLTLPVHSGKQMCRVDTIETVPIINMNSKRSHQPPHWVEPINYIQDSKHFWHENVSQDCESVDNFAGS